MKPLKTLSLLALLLPLAVSVQASDTPTNIIEIAPHGLEAKGGLRSNLSDGSIDVLLEISSSGFNTRQLLIGKFSIETGIDIGSGDLNSWKVEFVPVEKLFDGSIRSSGNVMASAGYTMAQFLPVSISGDLRLGVRQDITIHALGVYGKGITVSRALGIGFAGLAVKGIGLKLVKYEDEARFSGASIFSTSTNFGIALANLGRSGVINLVLGAETGLALGGAKNSNGSSLALQSNGKLSLMLNADMSSGSIPFTLGIGGAWRYAGDTSNGFDSTLELVARAGVYL